jgi:hypothetical protein
VDVLFVASYLPEGFVEHAEILFQAAEQLGVDYHIGAPGTYEFFDGTRLVPRHATDIYLGGRDADGIGLLRPLHRERPHIITRSTPQRVSVFQENIRHPYMGEHPYCWDAYMDPAYSVYFRLAELALHHKNLSDPAKNAGFLRADANLAVVFIADWAECSYAICGDVDESTWCDSSPPPPGCGTVDYYRNALWRTKGFRTGALSVHVIAHPPPRPHHYRYWDLAAATGGSGFDYQDLDNLEANLRDLAPRIFGFRSSFPLSAEPKPETIQVQIIHVNGDTSTPSGWTHQPETNSIVFDPLEIPAAREQILVTYEVVCAE